MKIKTPFNLPLLCAITLAISSCSTAPVQTTQTMLVRDISASDGLGKQQDAKKTAAHVLASLALDSTSVSYEGFTIHLSPMGSLSTPPTYTYELKPVPWGLGRVKKERLAETKIFMDSVEAGIYKIMAMEPLEKSSNINRSLCYYLDFLKSKKASRTNLILLSDMLESGPTQDFATWATKPEGLRGAYAEISEQLSADCPLAGAEAIDHIQIIYQSDPGLDPLVYESCNFWKQYLGSCGAPSVSILATIGNLATL